MGIAILTFRKHAGNQYILLKSPFDVSEETALGQALRGDKVSRITTSTGCLIGLEEEEEEWPENFISWEGLHVCHAVLLVILEE